MASILETLSQHAVIHASIRKQPVIPNTCKRIVLFNCLITMFIMVSMFLFIRVMYVLRLSAAVDYATRDYLLFEFGKTNI